MFERDILVKGFSGVFLFKDLEVYVIKIRFGLYFVFNYIDIKDSKK